MPIYASYGFVVVLSNQCEVFIFQYMINQSHACNDHPIYFVLRKLTNFGFNLLANEFVATLKIQCKKYNCKTKSFGRFLDRFKGRKYFN